MVNDTKAIDMVETGIRKRQSFFSIRELESSGDTEEFEALPRELDGGGSEVYPNISSPVFSELQPVCSDATANLEYVLTSETSKVRDMRDMPLALTEPFARDLVEIPASILLSGEV